MGNHASLSAPTPSRRGDGARRTADATAPPPPSDQADQHLTAIAARLTARGIASRLTRLGGTPVLTIDQPTGGPHPVTVTVDPDTSAWSGVPVDCTCLWTPALGTTPEDTADTIVTILNALRAERSLRRLPRSDVLRPFPARSAVSAASRPCATAMAESSHACCRDSAADARHRRPGAESAGRSRHRPFGRKGF
jgi:hypothetical protein